MLFFSAKRERGGGRQRGGRSGRQDSPVLSCPVSDRLHLLLFSVRGVSMETLLPSFLLAVLLLSLSFLLFQQQQQLPNEPTLFLAQSASDNV